MSGGGAGIPISAIPPVNVDPTYKYRYNSLVLGDSLYLDLYCYNNNQLVAPFQLYSVSIYFLDPNNITDNNPDGRRIKSTIYASNISQIETGHYRVETFLDDATYEVGDYIDVWRVKFNTYDSDYKYIENQFVIRTDLRETSGDLFVYDADFSFSPKKIMKGSKQYLKIGFRPIIHTDIGDNNIHEELIKKFYFNLKNSGSLYIRIELMEGCNYNSDYPLMNLKTDPEWDNVDVRGDNEAYYLLDTTENQDNYDLGIYIIQFKIELQGQIILSNKFYLQIMD